MKIIAAIVILLSLCVMGQPLLSPRAASVMSSAPLPVGGLSAAATPFGISAVVPRPSLGRVTLKWNPSPSADVVAHVIYFGTSPGAYFNSVSVNLPSTTTTLSGLLEGVKYYFSCTAVDASSLESDFSNEISAYTSARTTIRSERMAIESAGVLGKTNDIFMTTNPASNWTKVMTFTGNGVPVVYLHTNNSVGAYFKVIPR